MYRLGMMTEYVSRFGDIKYCLDIIKNLGFECADLTLFKFRNSREMPDEFLTDNYLENIKSIKDYAAKINLPLVQAHAPFPVHIDNDELYNRNMEFLLNRSIEICGLLGIKMLVIHPWNDWTIEENKIFFNKLIPVAEKYDVIICTENM